MLGKQYNNKKDRYKAIRYNALKLMGIFYKGGRCHFCHEYHPKDAYSFHHVKGAGKDSDISKMMLWMRDHTIKQEHINAFIAELDKCVLTCETCHRIAHELDRFDQYDYSHFLFKSQELVNEFNLTDIIKCDINIFKKMYREVDTDDSSSDSSGFLKRKLEPHKKQNTKNNRSQ